MQHQDSSASQLALLNMLAAGLRAGMPQPIGFQVDASHKAYVHTHTAADAARWEKYWRHHDTDDWCDSTRGHGGFTHHHRLGTWRGATVDIVHLTPTDQPVPETPQDQHYTTETTQPPAEPSITPAEAVSA